MYRIILIFTLFTLPTHLIASEEIRVGMTTALSGPLKQMGLDMKDGIESYFAITNLKGGINGKPIRLIVKDDGYEPDRAAKNMRYLIDHENVVAVIGNVGTPTALVTVPIANEKKTLLFGALTGANVLRKEINNDYVINYRASYAEEAEEMINGLYTIGIKPEEIAFFTQQDGFGNAGYNGVAKALKKRGFANTSSLPHGRYTRNTLNVESAVATILDAAVTPKVIIMAGTYQQSAKFIKLIKHYFPDMLFITYSFISANKFIEDLGDLSEGIIMTQVVPSFSPVLPAAIEFHQDFWALKYEKPTSFVSFEGYLVAKIFVHALNKIEGEITKENIIDSLNNIDEIDIGIGVNISYASNHKQAINNVWPMIIRNKTFAPLDWRQLKSELNSINIISNVNNEKSFDKLESTKYE